MIKAVQYKGIWWLPDNPEKKVTGYLTFNLEDGLQLEVIGDFAEHDKPSLARLNDYDIILGLASDGKTITLTNCMATSAKSALFSFPVLAFRAEIAFVGAHFQSGNEMLFKSVFIDYSYLNEWLSTSGFSLQFSSDFRDFKIEYSHPEKIEAAIDDECGISVVFSRTGPSLSKPGNKVSIKQNAHIKIEYTQDRSLDDYLTISGRLRDFLSLAVGRPIFPVKITALAEANRRRLSDGQEYHPEIQIIFQMQHVPESSKTLNSWEMLFTFHHIKDELERFLSNWFGKADILAPVYRLYFGTIYNPSRYLEDQFLSLTQAVESYHRRLTENQELPQEEHERRLAEIVDAVPLEYREWLKGRLSYSNEPNLRKRLKMLLDRFSPILGNLVGNKGKFINKVVTTRNYLTHYDPSLEGQAVRGEELLGLVTTLSALLKVCLLVEIGFGVEEVKDIVNRRKEYNLGF